MCFQVAVIYKQADWHVLLTNITAIYKIFLIFSKKHKTRENTKMKTNEIYQYNELIMK